MNKNLLLIFFLFLQNIIISAQEFRSITVPGEITDVQPMTGIVFWTSSEEVETKDIQLEFSYMLYSDIVSQKGVYNWKKVDDLLSKVASRGHQAILRFRFEYPGENGGITSVPKYIKESDGYNEAYYKGEDGKCYYADWSNTELQTFTLEFYSKFSERYDNDPRLAFLQTGFGHWAEYHIYGGPKLSLGKNFPSKDFQEKFIKHLSNIFENIQWSISIDAADDEYTSFADKKDLRDLNFGLFDDSFMCEEHDEYNKYNWNVFGSERYKKNVCGGEFSYYSDYDQKNVLNPSGLYGVTWEKAAKQYHISYIIGNDQPEYQPMSRIKSAGMASGYKFKITDCAASESETRVAVENTGTAPIYYDAFIAVNGVRAQTSLKGLQPGENITYIIESGGFTPQLSIECDRLVNGQVIQFEGNQSTSGIKENNSSGTTVHLNSSTGTLHVKSNVHLHGIQIADMSGKIVYMQNIPNSESKEIDFNEFEKGIYLVKVNNEVYKIMK